MFYLNIDKMTTVDYKIIKEPLPSSNVDRSEPIKMFAKQPVLYLELIENKNKVKQNLINKPYEPPRRSISNVSTTNSVIESQQQQRLPPIYQSKSLQNPQTSANIPHKSPLPIQTPSSLQTTHKPSLDTLRNSPPPPPQQSQSVQRSPSQIAAAAYHQEDNTINDMNENDKADFNKQHTSFENTIDNKDDDFEINDDNSGGGDDDDDVHTNISKNNTSLSSSSLKKTSLPPPPDRKTDKEAEEEEDDDCEKDVIPPTLKELQSKHPEEEIMKKHYKYAEKDDEEMIKKRNDVFFRYNVLKRMHPNAPIPEYTMYSDPDILAQKYQMFTKQLALDASVDNWKRYMIIFVMGLEVILGKCSFDVEGFAQHQLTQMSTYESLLVEMAEKSYQPNGNSKWPVEIRLLMMITVNMAMFIVCKIIQNKTGTNLLGTVSTLTGKFGGSGGDGGEKIMRAPGETL